MKSARIKWSCNYIKLVKLITSRQGVMIDITSCLLLAHCIYIPTSCWSSPLSSFILESMDTFQPRILLHSYHSSGARKMYFESSKTCHRKNVKLGIGESRCEYVLCYLLAVWLWANHFTSLSLTSFILGFCIFLRLFDLVKYCDFIVWLMSLPRGPCQWLRSLRPAVFLNSCIVKHHAPELRTLTKANTNRWGK